ncbi:MAG: ATP-binding protein [Chloroflexi bacterium]|nr:ATP-binding protein [Chloroflexota bacterium]
MQNNIASRSTAIPTPPSEAKADSLSQNVRMGTALSVLGIYALAYPVLSGIFENAVGIVSVVPVVVAGWLLGVRGGILIGMLIITANVLLVTLFDDKSVGSWLREGGVLGSAALLVVVTVVGSLRDLRERARQEIEDRKQAERALQHLVGLETIVSAISTKFGTSTPENIDATINEALGEIGEFAGIHRSYLFLFSDLRTKMDNTHEWCADGIEPQIEMLKDIPMDTFPWLMKALWRGESVNVPRVSDLPPEASSEKEEFEREGIQSLLLVPMAYGGAVRGFIGFDSVGVEKAWGNGDIRLLRMTSEIFASALERQGDEKELQHLYDQLEARVEERTAELSNANALLEKEVTERLQADAALKESIARQATILDALPDLMFRVSDQGVYLDYSAGNGEDLAVPPDQVIGNTIWNALPPDLAERVMEHIYKAIESRFIQRLEFKLPLPRGTQTFEGTINANGNNEAIVLIRNITERKQSEIALRESNLHLATALRDLEVAQHHMIQQERLSALGEMASGVAHDFNNALTPILGFSDLLISFPDKLNDRAQVTEYLQYINMAARDGADMVSRLREFYRKREESEQFLTVNLHSILEQAIMLTQPRWKDQAQADNVSIQVLNDVEETINISGKESRLREAFMNLIFNAVDAMPDGGTITLYANQDDEQVTIQVKDTGVGITPEVLQRSLEPFYTTKGEKGTGLGLAEVYGVVQRHKGSISLESEPGAGTTVIMRLPVRAEQVEEKMSEVEAPGRSLHVLVVDDEPGIRDVLTGYLTADGHSVETAQNGPEGMELFNAADFDVVLLDRAMPEVSGDQLAVLMKQVAPNVPVIMITGFASVIDSIAEKPPAVDLMITKPIAIDTLRQVLSSAIVSPPTEA